LTRAGVTLKSATPAADVSFSRPSKRTATPAAATPFAVALSLTRAGCPTRS
jgi:hypothetical protein